MFNTLVSLGLVAVTFATWPDYDIREMKFYVAMFFAMALGLLECYQFGFKRVRNGALILFLMYLAVSQTLSPDAKINLSGVVLNRFWSWEPLFKIGMMFFLFMAIQSHKFIAREITLILDTMVWCATVTAVYVMFQFINLDQFFMCHFGDNARLSGFIGNPTHCAPVLAMVAPIAILRKKYIHFAVMLLSVILIQSSFGYIGFFVAMLAYASFLNRRAMIWSLILFLSWILVVTVCYTNHVKFTNRIAVEAFQLEDNSRFEHWSQITKDVVSDIDSKTKMRYPLTGRGMGSFKVIYHSQHKNNYAQAHNEYLELLYHSGFIGLIIFLCAIWSVIKRHAKIPLFASRMPRYQAALLASIICILTVSCGTFILQIGTTAFYTVVVCGLLENQSDLIL